MDRENNYLLIPWDYGLWLGGLRWSDSDDVLEYGDSETFVFRPQLSLFLEGFAGRGRLPYFGQVLHLLQMLGFGRIQPSEPLRELSQMFGSLGKPLRNAGAFCAFLCRDIPPPAGSIDINRVCSLLWNTIPRPGPCAYNSASTYDLVEEATIGPAAFETLIAQELGKLPLEEWRHWLQHGCGSRSAAAEQLAQEIPAARFRSLAEALTVLEQRERLAGAMPFVAQMVSALALPPRRLPHETLLTGGYADVATRGHPERLLPSQFAFDDLEFVRRFAENELLYFRREEPSTKLREELVLLLDQGVRTWGLVRLVLSAAVLALGRFAVRRKLAFFLAGTSSHGRPIAPRDVDEQTLGELVEASDLTLHPGEALERILEERSDVVRDIVLLSHPRSLREEDVQAAARRVLPGTRLFALTVNERGQAQLAEVRHGTPVAISQFQVDMTRAKETPAEKPAASVKPSTGWSGAAEPIGFPFRFGVGSATTLLFDFDHAGEWILLASNHGMLHAFKVDGSEMEVLPRGMYSGKVLTEIDTVLGVAGGFAVGGRVGTALVLMHYDFGRRRCTEHLLYDSPNLAKPWTWSYFREYHSVVARCYDGSYAVDLGNNTYHPPRQGFGRATAACVEAGRYRVIPPHLFVTNPPLVSHEDCVALDSATGVIDVSGTSLSWKPFTPLADGKAILQGSTIHSAIYRGNVLAAIFRGRTSVCTLRLFRGPDGFPLGEYPGVHDKNTFTLSVDGRLLGRQVHNDQVEVRTVGVVDEPPLLTTLKGRSHQRLKLILGPRALHMFVGRWHHTVRWSSGEHQLMVTCSEKHISLGMPDIYGTFPDHSTASTTALPSYVQYDPQRFVVGIQAQVILVADAYGQVAVFDRSETLICMFFVFRAQLGAWMPDGTRLGLASITGGPATIGAREKICRALQEAWERGEEKTS